MILKLFRKVFTRATPSPVVGKPARIPVSQHSIRREMVSRGAVRVCTSLQENGFLGYIVGGAVRDLLIGHKPKDHDVATDATPEQVRSIFRHSRIIGRRFKIVHVMSGPETIEVSTFRADAPSETDLHGRVLSDNTYGSMAEDAARRDFTINALYYDPITETIIDFHHGVGDLQQKTLRMIGDPRTRYREDPVRLMRAVRLAAKLGLLIDPAARAPIREMASLLENVPAARRFDEALKLLMSGNAVRCVRQLREEGLHHGLLPLLDVILDQPAGERFIWLALESTDERVRQNKSVSPGFLFAALLWPEVIRNWKERQASGEYPVPALLEAMNDVLDTQASRLAITRRIASDIKDIWLLQPRFEKRTGKTAHRLIENPSYRASWDFLVLRAAANDSLAGLPDWWNRFAHADRPERDAMLREVVPEAGASPRKRRPCRKKPAATGTDTQPNG